MKCSLQCPSYKEVQGYPGLGYCSLATKDNDDPLDGLVKVGFECEMI